MEYLDPSPEMSKAPPLFEWLGFEAEVAENLASFYERLSPYMVEGEFCVVGGVPIRYYAHLHEQSYYQRPFKDLDIIIHRNETLRPSVREAFAIHHVHPTSLEGQYRFVLHDPVTDMKADVFPSTDHARRVVPIPGPRGFIPITAPEDQMANTVHDLQKLLRDLPVDPKQLADVRMLANIVELELANRIWQRRFPLDTTLLEALERAEHQARLRPDLVQTNPHHSQPPAACTECLVDPTYPLTERA